jgi:LysR family transcriptional activator of nhaA
MPRIVGEFEDSALLATFGAAGVGVFPAAELMHDKLTSRYEVKRIGACDGVEETFYAIGAEKKVAHPLVQKLLASRVHRAVG